MNYRNHAQTDDTRNRQKRGNATAGRFGTAGSPHRPGLHGRAFRRILCALVCASIICSTTGSVLPDSALVALAETNEMGGDGGSDENDSSDNTDNGSGGSSEESGTTDNGGSEEEGGNDDTGGDTGDTSTDENTETTDTTGDTSGDETTSGDTGTETTSDSDTDGTTDDTADPGDDTTDPTDTTDKANDTSDDTTGGTASGDETEETEDTGETTDETTGETPELTAEEELTDEEADESTDAGDETVDATVTSAAEAIASLPAADTFTSEYSSLYTTLTGILEDYEDAYDEYTSLLSSFEAAAGTDESSAGDGSEETETEEADLTSLAEEVNALASELNALADDYADAYAALTEYVDGAEEDADAAKALYDALSEEDQALVPAAIEEIAAEDASAQDLDNLTALLAAIETAKNDIASLASSLEGGFEGVEADDEDDAEDDDTVSDYVVTLDIDEEAVQAVIDAMADLIDAEEFAEEAQQQLDGLDVILADFEALAESGDPSESYIDEELAAAQDAGDEDGEAGLCYYEDTLLLGDAAVLYDEALEEEALALQADYAEAYEALLTYINEVTEAAAAASELYDALTDDERALFAGTWSSALTSENTTVLAVSSSSSASSEDDSEKESAASFAGSDLSGTAFTASDDDPYTLTDEDGASYTLTSAQAALAEQAEAAYENYTALEEALEEVQLTLEDYDEELTVEYIDAGDGEVTLTGSAVDATTGNTLVVTVTAKRSVLNGAKSVTVDIIEDADVIDAYETYANTGKSGNLYTFHGLYDITLLDEDGKEVEPADTVTASLSGTEIESYDDLSETEFLHFVENTDTPAEASKITDTEVLETAIAEIETIEVGIVDDGEITYETETFSVTSGTSTTSDGWTYIGDDYISNSWWNTGGTYNGSTTSPLAVLSTTGNYRLNTSDTTIYLNGGSAGSGNVITIDSGDTVVLDLNGRNLCYQESKMFTISNGGTLTIIDSAVTSTSESCTSRTKSSVTSSSYNLYGNTATFSSSNWLELTYYVTESKLDTDSRTGFTTESLVKYTTSTGMLLNRYGTYTGYDSAIYVSGGTLNLGGDVTVNGTTTTYSGPVVVNKSGKHGVVLDSSGGTFNMYDGSVIAASGTSDAGGGVYIDCGTFNMYGGVISGNVALSGASTAYTSGGGGVYVDYDATMTLSGGYITNNSVPYLNVAGDGNNGGNGGGGIYVARSDYSSSSATQGTLTISGGYITGNYAKESGGGVHCSGKLTMTGGTIASNVAYAAEGGGIRIQAYSSGSVISGGYITNNQTLTGKYTDDWPSGYSSQCADWGGGGIFVATYGSLTLQNMIVTGNEADGYGGGVAGCPTGELTLSGSMGALIYDNTSNGKNFSFGSTKWWDVVAYEQGYFTHGSKSSASSSNVAQDYYCPNTSIVSGTALGGGSQGWSGYIDSSYSYTTLSDSSLAPYVSSSDNQSISAGSYGTASWAMGLTATVTDETIALAEAQATLYVTGNYSYTNGGGIMTNGTLTIGSDQNVTTSAGLSLTATKAYTANGELVALEGGEFDFVVVTAVTSTTNTDGTVTYSYSENDVVYSSTNTATDEDDDGDATTADVAYTITFPLGTSVYSSEYYSSSGSTFTYTLYLIEDANSDNSEIATWSDAVYRIDVTVKMTSTSTSVNGTTYNVVTYTVTTIKVYEGVSNSDDSLLYDSSSSSSSSSDTETEGVTVTGEVGSSSSTASILKIGGDSATTAAFVNTKAVYSLPSTGGDGPVVPYTAAGLTLILAAAFVLLMTRRYLRGTAGSDDLHFWE